MAAETENIKMFSNPLKSTKKRKNQISFITTGRENVNRIRTMGKQKRHQSALGPKEQMTVVVLFPVLILLCMFCVDWEMSLPPNQKLEELQQQQSIPIPTHSLRIHLLPRKMFEHVMCPVGSDDLGEDSTICSSPLDHAIQDYRVVTNSFGNASVQYNTYRDIIDLKRSEHLFVEKFHSIARPWTSRDYSTHFISQSSLTSPLTNENHKHYQSHKRYLRFGEEFKAKKILSNTIPGMDIEFDVAWALVKEQLVDLYGLKRRQDFSRRQGKANFAGLIARKRRQYSQKQLHSTRDDSRSKDPGSSKNLEVTTSTTDKVAKKKTRQTEDLSKLTDLSSQTKRKKKKRKAVAKSSVRLELGEEFMLHGISCKNEETTSTFNMNTTTVASMAALQEVNKVIRDPQEPYDRSDTLRTAPFHVTPKTRLSENSASCFDEQNTSPSSCAEASVTTDDLTSSSSSLQTTAEGELSCSFQEMLYPNDKDPSSSEDVDAVSSFSNQTSLALSNAFILSRTNHSNTLIESIPCLNETKTQYRLSRPRECSVSQGATPNFCSMTPTKEQREKAYIELKRFQSEQIGRLVKMKQELQLPNGKEVMKECNGSRSVCPLDKDIFPSQGVSTKLTGSKTCDSILLPEDYDCTRLLSEILDNDEDDIKEAHKAFSKGEQPNSKVVETMVSFFSPSLSPMTSSFEIDLHRKEEVEHRQGIENSKSLYNTDFSLFFGSFHGDSWDRFSELSQGSAITTAKTWISNEGASSNLNNLSFLSNVKW